MSVSYHNRNDIHPRWPGGCCPIHQRGESGHLGAELIGDGAPLGVSGGVFLGVGGADPGGDNAALGLAGMSLGIAAEVDTAPLPGCTQHLAHRRLQALMGVGNDELDTAQTTAGPATQEVEPERLGLGGADCHAEHLAPPVGVDADGNGDDHRDDPAALAHLHVSSVQPQIGPVALDRPGEKGLHPLVDISAQAGDLTLADALHARRPHQIVHRTGRDAMDV